MVESYKKALKLCFEPVVFAKNIIWNSSPELLYFSTTNHIYIGLILCKLL